MKNATLAVVMALGLLAIISPAQAQWQYRESKRTLDPKVEKQASDFNRGQSKDVAEGVKAIEETCFYHISKFTAPYDQALPNFQATRRQLDILLAEGTPRQPPEARQALVNSIVRAAGSISASDEYSPAARINCVSILGELDDARDARQNLRKPSAPARERLLQIQSLPTTPGYLKAVALQGLERHAREGASGWDDATKTKVKEAALTYINEPFSEHLDYEVDVWLARRAFDLLRALRAGDAVDQAIAFLGDPEQSPSLRMSSLQYLITHDLQSLTPDQKKLYLLSTAHLLRSQLIAWYYAENDRQKRKSGASMGGMGGMGMGGMGMGGMGMGPGGDGGDFGDGGMGFGGPGMGMGGQPGMGGRGGGRGGRAVESQSWETRLARRSLNQLTQYTRVALDGRRASSESGRMKLYLASADLGLAQDYNLSRLVELLDTLQTTVNDVERISTVTTLMNRTKRDIEAIMRFVKNMPGFLEKYPELGDGDEELEVVPESGDEGPVAPAGDPTGGDGEADSGG